MKYVSSKQRLAKELLPIILKNRRDGQLYVEPFCGGCGTIQYVKGPRLANDGHKPLISMWKKLVQGWVPKTYSKEEYNHIKDNKSLYPNHVLGWVGFNLSYCGKYFGGYAGVTNTKQGVRDYQKEALANVLKQIPLLKKCSF